MVEYFHIFICFVENKKKNREIYEVTVEFNGILMKETDKKVGRMVF